MNHLSLKKSDMQTLGFELAGWLLGGYQLSIRVSKHVFIREVALDVCNL